LPSHKGMKNCVQQLNALYRNNPALYELQFDPAGFEWVETNKRNEGVLAFKRKGKDNKQEVLVVLNTTPVPRHQFPIHVYGKKTWTEIFNSDAPNYWGVGDLYNDKIIAKSAPENKEWQILHLDLPALSAIVLK
jgi:1,4-alpha-glucan branching enzyme